MQHVMMKCWVMCLSLLGLPSLAQDTYLVSLDPAKGLMSVDACFEESSPNYLTAGRRNSDDYLVSQKSKGFRLSRSGYRMYLSDSCIQYQVDLNLAKSERQARYQNGHWLVNNRAWFWRPSIPSDMRLEFVSVNDQPVKVSAPWPEHQGGYQAGNTPVGWTSRMMFGDIDVQAVILGEVQLNVAQTLDIPNKKRTEILEWIEEAAGSVAIISGQFPVHNSQILVVPIGKRREAVPWAEVQRAGRPAVHLFIDPTRPIEEFKADWTAVHELSHLLVPRIEYSDRWLSEGLASYYQNVAKARAGLLSAEQAWQKLRAGFAKGRRAFGGNLRDSKRTKHLYWGGAAIYFLADLRLRDLPQPQTLDQVMSKLRACCLPSDRLWTANALMEKLDELSQTTIFTQLLANEAIANQFPLSQSDENNGESIIARHLDAIFKETSEKHSQTESVKNVFQTAQ